MSKTVPATKSMEWKGLDRISEIVHGMNCIWREMTKDDFGLDGEIEVVTQKPDGSGFETTGGIVKVQAKAGKKYVVQDTETTFASPVEEKDLNYWHKCNFPVLFVVYNPDDDRLYFKEVKEYIKQSLDVFRKPHRIQFDKTRDIFGPSSKDAVCHNAGVSSPRISFSESERLFTNLLPISRLPQVLYRARTRKRSWQAIRDECSGRSVPPGCIVNGYIYALSDPMHEQSILRRWCIAADEPIPTKNWLESEERRSDFIFLLNQLLGKHMGRCGIRYNPEFGRNYFPRDNDTGREFKRQWVSERTNVSDERTVAKWYEYGQDKFWRHLAAETSFRQYGGKWFLQLIPKYFFTTDGETPCDGEFVGPYTTSQKANEHNSQVLNHVLFWSYILSQGERLIRLRLFGEVLMEIERLPLFGIAPFAIPDDPATFEEKAPPRHPTLFDTDGSDE